MLIKGNICFQSKRWYHAKFPVGKMSIRAKSCTAQELQYAYTPGVGYICEQIKQDPQLAKKLTMVGNNVCVISNGTAVLGLGDLGALLQAGDGRKGFVDAKISWN